MTGFQSKRGMAQEKTSMTKDEALKLAVDGLEKILYTFEKDGKVAMKAMIRNELFDEVNLLLKKAKKALAQPVQKHDAAIKTLEHLKYTYHGGEYWKPPLGKVKILAQPEENT